MGAAVTLSWASPVRFVQRKYLSRPISPFVHGRQGTNVACMIAVLLEKELGQPVNVINRTGRMRSRAREGKCSRMVISDHGNRQTL